MFSIWGKEYICNIIRISTTPLVAFVKGKRNILGKKVLHLLNALQQVSLGYSAVLPDTYNRQELLLVKCLGTSKSQIKYGSQNVNNQTLTCVRKYRIPSLSRAPTSFICPGVAAHPHCVSRTLHEKQNKSLRFLECINLLPHFISPLH